MGFFKKVWNETVKKPFQYATFQRNPLHDADDFINKKLGGYGNLALAAGIAVAGIATGGAAWAGGYGAMAAYGAAAAGVAAGVGTGISGAQAAKSEREANERAAAQQAEVDKANAQAETQRRANLLSLRKQVGATNVGAKSSVFSGGSTETKTTGTGVVLG